MARMLKDALKGILTQNEVKELYSAFDQIGEIIIVRIPDSLIHKKKLIGETLLDRVKIARSVFHQSSDVSGEFRTRSLDILAGTDNTETEYRESGCRFIIDVEKAFFSPRLSSERLRIANLVERNDTIVNMFAGVGMFSIIMAKNIPCTVYSIDINPYAIELCKKSIGINKLKGKVIPIQGDASDVIQKLEKTGDRTLMLLPERSDEFLDAAYHTLKKNGIIHYYSHIHSDAKMDAAKLSEEHYTKVGKSSKIINSKIVRAIGPRYYQTVVDAKVL